MKDKIITDPVYDSTMGVKGTIQALTAYLEVLQKGRVKPDRKGGGSVYDSMENLAEIEGVKERLNQLLDLDETTVGKIKGEQLEQKRERYNNKHER